MGQTLLSGLISSGIVSKDCLWAGDKNPSACSKATEALEHLGVPAGSIRILDRPIRNTDQEIRLIAEELGRVQSNQAIIVTSKSHTRRV